MVLDRIIYKTYFRSSLDSKKLITIIFFKFYDKNTKF